MQVKDKNIFIDEELSDIYASLLQDFSICPNYVNGGCEERARVICAHYDAAGFSDVALYFIDAKINGFDEVRTIFGFTKTECGKKHGCNCLRDILIAYNFHFAAGIRTASGQDIIFDPLIFDVPVMLKAWTDKFHFSTRLAEDTLNYKVVPHHVFRKEYKSDPLCQGAEEQQLALCHKEMVRNCAHSNRVCARRIKLKSY